MRCRIFQREGFIIADTMMKKGEQKRFTFREDTNRADIPSCAFYAEGHHTFTRPDGSYVAARPPGTFTLDRDPEIKAGEYILTADEDGSRCFCIESATKYVAQKWVQKQNAPSFTLQPGQCLLVCTGYVGATVGVLRTTTYHKPRDFLVASPFKTVVKSLDPESAGVLLSRG